MRRGTDIDVDWDCCGAWASKTVGDRRTTSDNVSVTGA